MILANFCFCAQRASFEPLVGARGKTDDCWWTRRWSEDVGQRPAASIWLRQWNSALQQIWNFEETFTTIDDCVDGSYLHTNLDMHIIRNHEGGTKPICRKQLAFRPWEFYQCDEQLDWEAWVSNSHGQNLQRAYSNIPLPILSLITAQYYGLFHHSSGWYWYPLRRCSSKTARHWAILCHGSACEVENVTRDMSLLVSLRP